MKSDWFCDHCHSLNEWHTDTCWKCKRQKPKTPKAKTLCPICGADVTDQEPHRDRSECEETLAARDPGQCEQCNYDLNEDGLCENTDCSNYGLDEEETTDGDENQTTI